MSERPEWQQRAIDAHKKVLNDEEECVRDAEAARIQRLLGKLKKLGVDTENSVVRDTQVIIDGIDFDLCYVDGAEYLVGTGVCASCGQPGAIVPLCSPDALGAYVLGELQLRHPYVCSPQFVPSEASDTRLLAALREYVRDVVHEERP